MNDDFVQYMHDNGWPIWVIAAVLFFLATGRSIVDAARKLGRSKSSVHQHLRKLTYKKYRGGRVWPSEVTP